MVQPPTNGIMGWWAYWRRRRTARRLGNEIFDEIQQSFQAALLARYNLSLQLDQKYAEESNRLQVARARSQADDLLAQEAGRRIVARRIRWCSNFWRFNARSSKWVCPAEAARASRSACMWSG